MIKNQSAFTLIELLVVIGVISLIATSALYALNPTKRLGESSDSRRKNELESLARAVELYTADHGTAPTSLASAGIVAGSKYVLCSSAGTLTCGGQTLACKVVNDSDFIGTYLPSLPIDPTKTATTDTGYYITRSNTNTLTLGACTTYSGSTIEIASRVNLPAYSVSCADGIVGGAEVCDYTGSTACPNNASYRYNAYTYNGSTCTANTYACNTSCSGCINQASCLGTCGSGGIYSGGFCYYMAPDDASSCDDVCALHNGGVCTHTAWNDNASCALMNALVGCGSCSSSGSASAPHKDTGGNNCYYRSSGAGNCSGIVGIEGFTRLCGCSK